MNTRGSGIGWAGGESPGPVVFFAIVLIVVSWTTRLSAGDAVTRVNDFRSLLSHLAGDLRGVYTPVEGRPLDWSLAFPASAEAVRKGYVRVTGPDFVLGIALEVDVTTGRLNWRVSEGHADLAAWLPALAGRPDLAPMLADLNATGIVTITGEGTWDDSVATGELKAELSDATVSNRVDGWTLEGVTLQVGGNTAELLEGRVPIELAVRTISTSRFGARALKVAAVLDDFERLKVKSARVEIAGGEVTAAPFVVPLIEPAISVTLVIERVGLQDLVSFVPTTLSEARGHVGGTLRLDWNPTEGVQVGAGELSLEKSEAAIVRLVSNPGFLTENVHPRFTFLSARWGPLARWFSSPNEAYGALSEIERGKIGLRVDRLDVRLTPEGDERGRSASAIIRARPEQKGSVIGDVTFEINVSGPLSAVLRLGMQESFSLQVQ